MEKLDETSESASVLVVEADAELRRQCEIALGRGGFEVRAVGGAAEARPLLAARTWDVVLLDVASPEAGGRALYGELREGQAEAPSVILAGETGAAEDLYFRRHEEVVRRPYAAELVVRRAAELAERARLYRLVAVTDALTGALSHHGVQEALADEIVRAERSCHPLAVGFIDVDGFAQLNQDHGHRAGDQVLSELVWLFRARMRRSDRIGRTGGGQFLAIFPETKVDGALLALENRRKEFADLPFTGREASFKATFSAGVASFPDDAEQSSRLLEAARTALQRAKERGGNRAEMVQGGE